MNSKEIDSWKQEHSYMYVFQFMNLMTTVMDIRSSVSIENAIP